MNDSDAPVMRPSSPPEWTIFAASSSMWMRRMRMGTVYEPSSARSMGVWPSAATSSHDGRSAAPAPSTSRSRWPCMQNATGPCVVWKFLAMSG